MRRAKYRSGRINRATKTTPYSLMPTTSQLWFTHTSGLEADCRHFDLMENPDNIHGSYMAGTGDVVGVLNSMTTFAVYNYLSTDPNGNEILVIGQPPDYGSIRSDIIYGGDMYFSTWAYDYPFPFLGASNTYRIWTTVLDTNLSIVDVYDNSATNATNFSAGISEAVTPAPGFYVGGLNPAIQFVVNNRCFDGDIAELIVYSGQLSDADRLSVLGYLEQKYYTDGSTNGLSFQWQFDGTNIVGATDTNLTLTNVQPYNAGTYSVTVTDSTGSTLSSNAVLTVGYSPSITAQPQSQEVLQGTNVTFAPGISGTAPLTFQWSFNGVNLTSATNSALTLSDVQTANAGNYQLTVSSPYGTVISSNATLTVDQMPVIAIQPQSQSVLAGSNITLSVVVGGTFTLPSTITSGTLQLWLKADAGLVVNTSGQVSSWHDQSGNFNDASQPDTNNQPSVVYPSGIGGLPALRFNGNPDNVHGKLMVGTGEYRRHSKRHDNFCQCITISRLASMAARCL